MTGRFARYLERRWDFMAHVATLRDNRKQARIPTSAVFLTVFLTEATRLGPHSAHLGHDIKRIISVGA